MHGFGTYRFADGMIYEGVMRDNWPCGEGTARYPNGGVYIGRWKEGKYQVILVEPTNVMLQGVVFSGQGWPKVFGKLGVSSCENRGHMMMMINWH